MDHFSIVLPSVCPTVTKLVRISPQKLLERFHPNLTGIISTKSSCVHLYIISIFQFNGFCQSYDPLLIFIFKVWVHQSVRLSQNLINSQKLHLQIHPNLKEMISVKSCFAYHQHFTVKLFNHLSIHLLK